MLFRGKVESDSGPSRGPCLGNRKNEVRWGWWGQTVVGLRDQASGCWHCSTPLSTKDIIRHSQHLSPSPYSSPGGHGPLVSFGCQDEVYFLFPPQANIFRSDIQEVGRYWIKSRWMKKALVPIFSSYHWFQPVLTQFCFKLELGMKGRELD